MCAGPNGGQVAQLVEQRTENPRVDGSIPSLATTLSASISILYLSGRARLAARVHLGAIVTAAHGDESLDSSLSAFGRPWLRVVMPLRGHGLVVSRDLAVFDHLV